MSHYQGALEPSEIFVMSQQDLDFYFQNRVERDEDGPAQSTGGQAGQQAPDNRQVSPDSFGASKPSEPFAMPQEDVEPYSQGDLGYYSQEEFDSCFEDLPFDEQPSTFSAPANWQDETHQEALPNDAHVNCQQQQLGWHPSSTYGYGYGNGTAIGSQMPLNYPSETMLTNGYPPASANPNDSVQFDANQQLTVTGGLADDQNMEVNDANMAGPSSSSGGGAGYVLKVKPRKYQLEPDTEKMNPTYKLKRDWNNDAVCKLRLKAKEEQEKRDAELKNLRDKVHSQETEIETLKRENRDLRLQLRLFLQKN